MGRSRRIARNHIAQKAHFDRVYWESVDILSQEDLFRNLSTKLKCLKFIQLAAIPAVERVEALYDSRGLGSLQGMEKDQDG